MQAAPRSPAPSPRQRSAIPPYARSHRDGTARLVLNYSQGDLTGGIKARGEGGNTAAKGRGGQRGPRGVAPGLRRAPVPRRGAGFGVRVPPPAGHGGAGGGSEGAPPPVRRFFPRIKPA